MAEFSGMNLGVFGGPWQTGHVARDGAVIGFADVETALAATAEAAPEALRTRTLRLEAFLDETGTALAAELDGLDAVYANCGPLAALLLHLRAVRGIDIRIIREVRTLGWVGYAFQEFAARDLGLQRDAVIQVSRYARGVWHDIRPADRDRVFYPLLTDSGPAAPVPPDGPLKAGFLGRVERDKGLQYVPAMIHRLHQAGWPIAEMHVCGDGDDKALLTEVAAELGRLGVTCHPHGERDHAAAMTLLGGLDVILFPSVSSLESLGRVVLEAWQAGKPVFASDYCAGHDLLTPACRVPLRWTGAARRPCADAFPIAELDVAAWHPPAPGEPIFQVDDCATYRRSAAAALDAVARERRCEPPAPPALRMAFDWGALALESRESRCRRVWRHLVADCRGRADLLDLGGAMKRAVLAAGFNPQVRFQRR